MMKKSCREKTFCVYGTNNYTREYISTRMYKLLHIIIILILEFILLLQSDQNMCSSFRTVLFFFYRE